MRRHTGFLILSLNLLGHGFGQIYNVSTFAGGGFPTNVLAPTASLQKVSAVAVDLQGNPVIALSDYSVVLRVESNGQLTTVAGTGQRGYSGDTGPATHAMLNGPAGIAVDAAGSIYIADSGNQVIRKVSNGVIETVAGGGSGGDGPALKAHLQSVKAVAVDRLGQIYLVDGNTIKTVSDGIITTIAGNPGNGFGGDNGSAIRAQFSAPAGIVVDAGGAIYVADYLNARVRMIANGIVTTVAGGGSIPGSGDGGSPVAAGLGWPSAVTVTTAGDLYIADAFSRTIRKVSGGVITTVAGNGFAGYNGDNIPATTAWLNMPSGVAIDNSGSLYIADQGNFRLRKVTQGIITTVAGGGPGIVFGNDGQATSAQFIYPQGLAVDASAAVYIADPQLFLVMKVSGGAIGTVAGNGQSGHGCGTGPVTTRPLDSPGFVATDSAGNLYISDLLAQCVLKVAGGVITAFAGGGNFGIPAWSGDNGPATSASLNMPQGIAVDSAGSLYIADSGNHRIRKVSNGVITTVAGNGTTNSSGDGGPATSAGLGNPTAVAVDAAGKLYIADGGAVRVVSNGVISTVTNVANSSRLSLALDAAGNLYDASFETGQVSTFSNGVLTTIGQFGGIGGIAVDGANRIYISDQFHARVFVMTPITAPCVSSVSPQTIDAGPYGGRFSFIVQAPASCSWTAVGAPAWIAVYPSSGAGLQTTVWIDVPLYLGPARSGTMLVGGIPVTVNQSPDTPPPLRITSVINAMGGSIIAPNTWVTIMGSGLAPNSANRSWRNSDFVNDMLPTELDGVSVTVNGKGAFVSYISPTQVNILTPPDLVHGSVSVVLTNGGAGSDPFNVQADSYSPTFFVLASVGETEYILAQHADNSLVAPPQFLLTSTPAKPGETVVLYANGFGETSSPVISGSIAQTGTLPVKPTVTVGRQPASVQFAGLISPGLFQFNVVIPTSAADGDDQIIATYNGIQTQPQVVITVHR